MTKSSSTRGWKSSCVRLALLCLVSFFALLAAELNAIAQGAAASKVYTISPRIGAQGKTYRVTVESPNCKAGDDEMNNATLISPDGSGVTVREQDNHYAVF